MLVVEDEPQMRRLVQVALAANGYRVVEASSAEEGIRMAATYAPDVIVLDLGLPDTDGLDLVRSVRGWSKVPVLVISARGREDSKVTALDEGADDYLTKPFAVSELLARIRVALRHAASAGGDPPCTVVTLGDAIAIDLARRVVTRRGERVHLTPNEYKLLVALVKHAGMVMTHRQLLHEVWGPGSSERVEYLRVYVTQLRAKLEDEPARPRFLRTELGVGYRLDQASTLSR